MYICCTVSVAPLCIYFALSVLHPNVYMMYCQCCTLMHTHAHTPSTAQGQLKTTLYCFDTQKSRSWNACVFQKESILKRVRVLKQESTLQRVCVSKRVGPETHVCLKKSRSWNTRVFQKESVLKRVCVSRKVGPETCLLTAAYGTAHVSAITSS